MSKNYIICDDPKEETISNKEQIDLKKWIEKLSLNRLVKICVHTVKHVKLDTNF